MARSTGRVDPRLTVPVPAAGTDLWLAWQTLGAIRTFGSMAVNPISLADIEVWQRLTGARLSPWAIDTLIHMDAAALAVARNAVKAKQQQRKT